MNHGDREPLEPISDPRQDPLATWALALSFLALGSVVAVVRAHVHRAREQTMVLAIALLALIVGVIALARRWRDATWRTRGVPVMAIAAAALALGSGLILFVVH